LCGFFIKFLFISWSFWLISSHINCPIRPLCLGLTRWIQLYKCRTYLRRLTTSRLIEKENKSTVLSVLPISGYSLFLTSCPSDKRHLKLEMHMEHWWNDTGREKLN
jgi:hypothetical protein